MPTADPIPNHRPVVARKITRVFSAMCATALGAAALAAPALAAPDDPVPFTDARLQECVNSAIDSTRYPDDAVTVAEAAALTELECHTLGIASLGGVEHLHNLTELVLHRNAISDISPLAALTGLETLRLEHNQISDVSVLANLTNLAHLDLTDNDISDVSPLVGLDQAAAQGIGLGENRITDISLFPAGSSVSAEDQFVDLGNVNEGEAIANPVKGSNGDPVALNLFYDAQANTFSPTVLGAGAVQWDESSAFSGTLSFNVLPASAAHVDFSDSNLQACVNGTIDTAREADAEVTEAEAIALDRLTCEGRGIETLGGIEHLINLTHLDLSQNQIADISALAPLTDLDYLNLTDNQVTDVSALSGLTNLTGLELSKNQITDIAAVGDLTHLELVYLRQTPVSDIGPLTHTTELQQLFAGGSKISDLGPLTGLVELWRLDLSGNEVSDVAPLENLTKIEYLYLEGNRITDISPLAGLMPDILNVEDQQVFLGDLTIDEAIANPVIDLAGDPVPLSDLYAPATNTFTPTTLGDATITWVDGDIFTGTLSFTTVDAASDGDTEGDDDVPNGDTDGDEDAGDDMPHTGVSSFALFGGIGAVALLALGGAFMYVRNKRHRTIEG